MKFLAKAVMTLGFVSIINLHSVAYSQSVFKVDYPRALVQVNQPTKIWVTLLQDDKQIGRDQCQSCKMSLLAPDGQVLNEFDAAELQPIAIAGHPGAFGATMTFGAPGEFAVRVEGHLGQSLQANPTPFSLTFSVVAQGSGGYSGR